MNTLDTLTATEALAAAPAAARPVADDIATTLRRLSSLLCAAANEDELDLNTGDSTRLLRMAAMLAGQAGADWWGARDAEHVGYEIAALVIAATSVQGDNLTERTIRHLRQVEPMLKLLTDAEDVLRGCLAPRQPAATHRQQQRDALVAAAAMEIQSWAALLRPHAISALSDLGAVDRDGVDFALMAPTIFQRIDELGRTILYAFDEEIITVDGIRKVLENGQSFEEARRGA